MFSIRFAPKATPGKGEIPVFDKVYEDFASFTIDLEKRRIRVPLHVNSKQLYMSHQEMFENLKFWWDISKLHYEKDGSVVYVYIPEDHEVLVILK